MLTFALVLYALSIVFCNATLLVANLRGEFAGKRGVLLMMVIFSWLPVASTILAIEMLCSLIEGE